jgi:hypothetical protein
MLMSAIKPAKIVHALVLFDEKNSREYGLALWAALHEVERFYQQADSSLEFSRFYISPYVPTPGLVESAWRGLGKMFASRGMDSALELLRQEERVTATSLQEDVAEPYRKTYNQKKLAHAVRNLVPQVASGTNLLVVTDRAITPPPNWRYIIWETFEDESSWSAVISVAPLDPRYWRDRDPNRIATIKHRTRCAAMSVTGDFLGISRCRNPECFCFDDVDSVIVLDDMKVLGAEHEIPELTDRGFDAEVTDPTAVQPVVHLTTTKGDR